MGAPCSCARPSRKQVSELPPVIQCKSFSNLLPYTPELDFTGIRQELLTYLVANDKDISTKVQVLFQRAINFPDEGLREFDIEHWQARESDWPHFLRLLYTGRFACRLRLEQVSLSATAFEILCRGVSVLKELKILQLTHLALGMYSTERVVRAVAGLKWLEIVNFAGNSIGAAFVDSLFKHLPRPSYLHECILDENDINDIGALVLAQILPQHPQLQVLSLHLNPLTPQGVALLLPFQSPLLDLQLPEVLPYIG